MENHRGRGGVGVGTDGGNGEMHEEVDRGAEIHVRR